MKYRNKAPAVDFFASLGQLPPAQLAKTWYSDVDGARSPLGRRVLSGKKSWQRAFWKVFERTATTKLSDWRHEQEYRLLRPDPLGMHGNYRTVRYELSELCGIVFGFKTTAAHKRELAKVLDRKFKADGREDFRFFDMKYLAARGRLVRV